MRFAFSLLLVVAFRGGGRGTLSRVVTEADLAPLPPLVQRYPSKLAAILAAYWLFWQALRLRPLRWVFTKLTPTHYWRRYHEPHTRVVDLEPGRVFRR